MTRSPFYSISPTDRQYTEYVRLLTAIGSLSGLFSDNTIPYIGYRATENIFCRAFGAENLSRSDTAFDAKLGRTGLGLKTFICTGSTKLEKVAEFNSLSAELNQLPTEDLARRLAIYRNERIELASRLYNIDQSFYHIIGRGESELLLFDTDYSPINLDGIQAVVKTRGGIQFSDGIHDYAYNRSKSVLLRRFEIPNNAQRIPINIIEDPYEILLRLCSDQQEGIPQYSNIPKVGIILPLYGYQAGRSPKVFERSGLNQWNARGRKRDYGEVYIPIPSEIHKRYPDFFPPRDETFQLRIPTGELFEAKVCQDGGKALMTNPNKALSDWLLRKLFRLAEGELLTYDRMLLLGFDSVSIYKDQQGIFHLDKAPLHSFEQFIWG